MLVTILESGYSVLIYEFLLHKIPRYISSIAEIIVEGEL